MARYCKYSVLGWLTACLLATSATVSVGQVAEQLDIPMFRMPEPEVQQQQKLFQKGLADLWIRALESDRDDMKIKASEALARSYRLGYDSAQTASPILLAEYAKPEASSKVKAAIATALGAMNVRDASDLFLADLESAPPQLYREISPSLAAWQVPEAIAYWTEGLRNPTTREQDLKECIQRLRQAQVKEVVEDLLRLVMDQDRQMSLRMEAARAASELSPQDLESTAQALIDRNGKVFFDQLLAAELLADHSSQSAIDLLLSLVTAQEPTVALVAARRLEEIDIQLLYPVLIGMSSRDEQELQRIAIRGLDDRREADDTQRLLEMLGDLHPQVRHDARVTLEGLAEVEALRPIILETASEQLAEMRGMDEWRRLEQLAVLVGNLDHEPPAMDLVELLDHPRPEAAVAAAWGLSRIQVAETFPIMVEFAAAAADKSTAEEKTISPLVEEQLTHLFQALGLSEYEPAKETLIRYIPKNGYRFGTTGRAAAVWALGLIQKGQVDEELAAALAGRMLDGASSPPEAPVVRRMSAISIGRMKAASQLEALRSIYGSNGIGDAIGWSAIWSIHEITGEPIPSVPIRELFEVGWFLVPTGDRESEPAQPRD